MNWNSLENLKKHFGFEAWRGTNALGRDIVRRQITLPQKLLRDLVPGRVREIDPADGTRLLRASWSVPGDVPVTIFVDLRECDSLEKAHEVVLELLANVQAPDIKRMKEPIGDVSFKRGDSNSLIFARGNIAVTIRNVGDKVVPIDKYAQMIDDWIVGGKF